MPRKMKTNLYFQIGQIMSKDGSGIRMRIYRQIAGGGYSHVTALSGAASGSNSPAAFAGNFGSHTDSEDENRTRTIGGSFVDSPNTTSQVDYKLYFGQGEVVYQFPESHDDDFDDVEILIDMINIDKFAVWDKAKE